MFIFLRLTQRLAKPRHRELKARENAHNFCKVIKFRSGSETTRKRYISLLLAKMNPLVLLHIFFLLLYFENISTARILKVDEKYPRNKNEIDVCGNIRDVILRNSARFLKILVRNTNTDISFYNDDSRRMTARAKSKLDVLASRVQGRWSGRKIRVLKAWTDAVVHGSVSLHYEGRALQLRVDDNDKTKLGVLAGLAVESGFDFVHFTKSNYVYASVIRDVCQTSVDFSFILDTSGSVGYNNFEKIKTFVKHVIDFFNIGSKGTHVAVVTYSTWPQVEFNLDTHTTKTSLKKAVNQIYYRAGWTYTADAIELTKNKVFSATYGMRPDKGIPKVAVLLTDGYSSNYGAASAATELKKKGVSIFSIGVGSDTNEQELKDIASDPDSSHVFNLENFNDLSVWVDRLSAVSCDEGAAISACDDTISKVEGGSFLYFKTEFKSNSGGISVEVRDTKGISHLYASLKSKNPGPMDPNSWKNEIDASPRSLRITFPSHNSKQLVYVAVQGQRVVNEFKLSMWDTLFPSDSYTANPTEENKTPVKVIRVSSSLTQYRLRYSITYESNTQRMFRIDQNSGQITTTGRLDREKTPRYDLTVLAQDINNKCHKGRTVVTVLVKDINDNAPTFAKSKYYADVSENRPSGTSVAIVTATDKDSSSVLKYRLINNFKAFSIDNNGVVRTTMTLDYERQIVYTLDIRANDGKHEARTFLQVRVVNVNERPVFRASCVTSNQCVFRVSEDAAVKKIITTLVATDPDGGTIKYTLRFLDTQDKVFSIDSLGKISLLKKLDRETKSVYNLLVTASDDGKPVLAAEARVKVVVTDVNDNAPKFPRDSYTGNVYENTYIGRIVIQVVAVDADSGTNNQITYSLQGSDHFTIVPSTGLIKTRKFLDREKRATYQLTVRATDGGGLYGQTLVRVNVLDDNDHTPRFTKSKYDLTVSENVKPGTEIGQVSATDNDIGINQDLRYSIYTDNVGNFYIDPKTGALKVMVSLDYERRSSYTMWIAVTDRGSPARSSTSSLVVTVTDVNDNSPIFGSSSYRATVKENSAKGTSVLKVLATDLDSRSNGEVQYFITNGNSYNTFTVNQDSGLIAINNPPSFKTKSQYDLTIEARDQGVPMKNASVHAAITIEDVNDNVPKFDKDQYKAQVRENAPKGTPVITVTANDDDTGPRGRVLYSMVSGNAGNKFTIDGSTGAIKVSSPLDRETTSSFVLTIEARDGGNPPLNSKCVVNVEILDINDNAPIFSGPYSFHVTENKPQGTLVGQVTAMDRDIGVNGNVSYSGTTGTFNVHQTTGKITLLKTLDHETQALYSLTVTARDHGSPSKQTATVVKVIVDDVNDNPPKFPKDMYNCSVAENMASGAAVCYVTAVDLDSGANGRLFYSLTGGNNKFTINSATGELTTTAPLDREATGSYHLRVTAKDGQLQRTAFRSALSFSDTVDVYVTIQDENDNQPTFVGTPFKFHVSELATAGTVVGHVVATDADVGPNGKLTFVILEGNTGSAFSINSESGVISVKNVLDRETTASYALTVQAKDSGKPLPQATRTVVMVTIDDVNDNPPVFDQNIFHGAIREDASIGSSVLQVKAHDSDAGSNGLITLTLSGPGSENFTIDATGFVKSATALDYEKTSMYFMTVTAKDSGKPSLNATAHVNISIVNVNDNVPTFESQAQITDVSEDVAIGTRVVKLNATDSDGSSLRFSIIDGNEGDAFAIGQSSGVISVAKRLDRETTPNYTLIVEAKDQDGKAVTNNATIRVLDVNDNKPTFDKSSYSAKITENNAKGVTLVKVHATDRDEGDNAKIIYLLTSGDKTKFQVRPSTGVITAREVLDREHQSSYVLSITAKDHGSPSQSSVVKVTITVDDVNDNTPRFPQSTFRVSVAENTALNSVVLRLHASDPDWDSNGRVSYVIVSGNANNAFKLNPNTGELSVTGPIDREAMSGYSLVVRASDSGSPHPRSSIASVVVTVTDENDNAPKYTNQNTTFVVKENAARGTQVGVVMATDADVGENERVKFEIVRGAEGAFVIGSSSGVITVDGQIDRETKATYPLTIRASDHGSPVMFTEKSFDIVVEDVNDNPPVFKQKFYRASIRESVPVGSGVETVQATDADTGANAEVRYQIVSGNSQRIFTIDPISGNITTQSTLDYEDVSSYLLNVSATDTKHTSYVRVSVDVVNINDNRPVFTKRAYTGSVQENAAVLTRILSVSANDEDPFGGLVYSLNASYPYSDRFNIDPTSGAISTAESLDRETKDTYVIQALVKDSGVLPTLSDAAMVTITVTDVNDNPPTFNGSSFSVSVLENATVGTSVFKLDANDRDLENNAKISYSLVPSSSAFQVEPNTGIIRTTAKLNRETTSSYTLMGSATDYGNPRRTSKQVVIHVTVLDVNDNAPRFEKDPYYVDVKEDEAVGSVVEEVVAIDPDLDDAGKVVYSITGSNGVGVFVMDNVTGIISLRKTLNREIKDSYKLTVTASDLGTPPLSSTTLVNIKILDVNDNIPQFNTSSLRGSVKENEPAGTYVMRLTATDKDLGPNGQLTFELLTQEYQTLFSINDSTGVITTKKKLDREAQASYTLKTSVSDMGTPRLMSSVDVIIDVIDVDDNCPFFQPSKYNVTIRENEKRGTHIAFVSATDPDKVANNIMGYKIKSGMPGGEFRINATTGEITVDNNVDRESTAAFKLTVRAGEAKCDESDKNDTGIEGGSTDVLSSASAIVYIYVEDVNDNAPQFKKSSYEYDFDDITTTELFTITATDDDLGMGGTVEYSLVGLTEVNGNRHVTVSAKDEGSPSLDSNVTVVVKTSLTCEAMVFHVTKGGKITTKTLCRFDQTPASKTVNSGLSHELKCSAQGNTHPEYRWMLNGRFITSWSPNGTYSVKRVSQEDEGRYSCLARSDAGIIQSIPATLTVYDVPVIITHPENSSVPLEGTTTLECLAKGDPEPIYQWFKNGEFLPPSDGIDPTNLPKLVLEKAIPQDEAWYSCVVINAAGKVTSKSAFLKVYAPKALVNLEISVTKPHPDRRCHMFDINSFKALLNKVVEGVATFTNVSAEGMCKPDQCGNCKNGGVCEQQGTGNYSCVCSPGWTGKQCGIDVNECLRAPCLHGNCQNKLGTYECTCSKNFTGKNCNLREDACVVGACNKSELCVRWDVASRGYQCVHESKAMVMVYKDIIDKSRSYDLEREIEGLIKSAPNVDVNTKRRRRNTKGPDYGSCTVRITSFSVKNAYFVLLCPPQLNVDPQETTQFVCALLFKERKTVNCGTGSALMTPMPPTTYPPMPPMRVKIVLFARDGSNKDMEGNDVVNLLQSEDFQREMGKQGVEFVTANRAQKSPRKNTAEKKANVGLIVGLVALVLILAIVVVVAGYVYLQKCKGKQTLIPVEERGVANRGDSRRRMIQRNSTKDITRSEKKFINQAFTGSVYDDGEDEFMVEVNLPSLKKKPTQTKALEALNGAPYYYDKIAPIEAEMLLDNKVPVGTFLVRKGIQPEEYVLTVKCPEGGPSHRHLLITHTSKDNFELQFGSMPLSLEFDSICDIIEHFQCTPIEFGGDEPDVALGSGWNTTV